jgi:hypothetical protein
MKGRRRRRSQKLKLFCLLHIILKHPVQVGIATLAPGPEYNASPVLVA